MSPPSFRVEFTKSAQKEFLALPVKTREKTLEVLTLLRVNPQTELLSIKKLKGADSLYRVRLGDYRLVYEVQQHVLLVLIIKVGHRKDIYRFLR